MGSSFSIINDTDHDVWITYGVNRKVLGWTLFGFGSIATIAAGFGLLVAESKSDIGNVNETKLMETDDGFIVALDGSGGLKGRKPTQVPLTEAVSKMTPEFLAAKFNVDIKDAKKMKKWVKKFQKCMLLKPGEKFVFKGSLSLTQTVYVMNDALQRGKRNCYTGATHRSNNRYAIPKHFKKLSKEVKPEHTLTVYK